MNIDILRSKQTILLLHKTYMQKSTYKIGHSFIQENDCFGEDYFQNKE